MSDADFQPPAPTPEHERLADHAGAWKVACTYYWGPEPMQNEARETGALCVEQDARGGTAPTRAAPLRF